MSPPSMTRPGMTADLMYWPTLAVSRSGLPGSSLVWFGNDGPEKPLPAPMTWYWASQSFSSGPGSCHSSDFLSSAKARTPASLLTLADPSGLKYSMFGLAEQTNRLFQFTTPQKGAMQLT